MNIWHKKSFFILHFWKAKYDLAVSLQKFLVWRDIKEIKSAVCERSEIVNSFHRSFLLISQAELKGKLKERINIVFITLNMSHQYIQML